MARKRFPRPEPNRMRGSTLRHDHVAPPAVTLPTLDEVCPPAQRPCCVHCGGTLKPWWITAYSAGGADLSRPPDPAAVSAKYDDRKPHVSGEGEYRVEWVYARSKPYQVTSGLGALWEGWNGLYLGEGRRPSEPKAPPFFCSESCAAAYGVAAYLASQEHPDPERPE